MSSLGKYVAIEKMTKSKVNSVVTKSHRLMGKSDQMRGLIRKYRPREEEGEVYPSEQKNLHITAQDLIDTFVEQLVKLFDVVATKDWGNCLAKANVVVDGQVLVKQAPVPYLLFLEKQLNDIGTFVNNIPTLDQSERWYWDETTNNWQSETKTTIKTKKVSVPVVLYEATDKHPAQVQLAHEDILEGYWETTKFSGEFSQSNKQAIQKRVTALKEAVKSAVVEANKTFVEEQNTGKRFFDFIFKG